MLALCQVAISLLYIAGIGYSHGIGEMCMCTETKITQICPEIANIKNQTAENKYWFKQEKSTKNRSAKTNNRNKKRKRNIQKMQSTETASS